MREIETIEFRDQADEDYGVAVVRAAHGSVALALSLRQNGDIDVFMAPGYARQLIAALERAVELAESGG